MWPSSPRYTEEFKQSTKWPTISFRSGRCSTHGASTYSLYA
ncbi:hypothetical protein C4K39_5120 [Pseudomonas sessilinigenes]|nr:hypothetical protein C4K39_5120 [Pseudomonas sessilinigenes]